MTMSRALSITTFLAALAALPIAARAQEAEAKRQPSIRVSAESKLSEKPDRAEITLGVVTTAKTAPAATSENAKRVEAVLAAVKGVVGSKADIQTIGFSLVPSYEQDSGVFSGSGPKITGYTASNLVRIRSGDMTKVGPAIDAGLEAGANSIHGLQFSLEAEDQAREKALADAAKKAMGKARALAAALGLETGKVLALDEAGGGGGPIFPQMTRMASMKMDSAPTPIEAGTIEITANVTLELEIVSK